MLLVIAYTSPARQQLRNVERSHSDAFVRRFGRVGLLEETEFGALLALRLRERHGADVQVAMTDPFNEFDHVPDQVREAAVSFAGRDTRATPYDKFASGTPHPQIDELRGREL